MLESIELNGWVELGKVNSDRELKYLAKSIGSIERHPNGEEVYTLRPKSKLTANRNSFSGHYGLDAFPFHTDTAYKAKPVRFIILHAPVESSSPTRILPFKKIIEQLSTYELSILSRAIFILNNKQSKYYTSFEFREDGKVGYKYDPICMKPVNNQAETIQRKVHQIMSIIEPIDIFWFKGRTVLIDNWATLHGRASVINESNSRVLKRIYLNQK